MSTRDNSNGLTVRIYNLESTTTTAKIKSLFSKYNPISYDIPRYKTDTPISSCIIKTNNSTDSDRMIEDLQNSEWEDTPVKIQLDKMDESDKTLIFVYRPLEKNEDEVKEFLSDFNIRKVTQIIKKKGELKGDYITVVVKDFKTLNQMLEDFNKKVVNSRKLQILYFDDNGTNIRKCFVCGKFGHKSQDCPEKESEKKIVEEKEEQKSTKVDNKKTTQKAKVLETQSEKKAEKEKTSKKVDKQDVEIKKKQVTPMEIEKDEKIHTKKETIIHSKMEEDDEEEEEESENSSSESSNDKSEKEEEKEEEEEIKNFLSELSNDENEEEKTQNKDQLKDIKNTTKTAVKMEEETNSSDDERSSSSSTSSSSEDLSFDAPSIEKEESEESSSIDVEVVSRPTNIIHHFEIQQNTNARQSDKKEDEKSTIVNSKSVIKEDTSDDAPLEISSRKEDNILPEETSPKKDENDIKTTPPPITTQSVPTAQQKVTESTLEKRERKIKEICEHVKNAPTNVLNNIYYILVSKEYENRKKQKNEKKQSEKKHAKPEEKNTKPEIKCLKPKDENKNTQKKSLSFYDRKTRQFEMNNTKKNTKKD
ncbi:rRNA-processing protein EBP2, putative [Entamoeba invadens IP1]|uniref:rRNA-processing protein EBP2, putative n=1 Tax=Entamoeba invadens IP1 TaxID=370355 RepID=A0A0A1UDF1_ENTIV|nr:rRNA-processing protein EBP2, putative [Entamoeba invadens IP1]ELP90333.1 rRNA-processing protein EBP2, putative [Entamoeba invadens IP1]|eukprot:XP_004257104.1 rRNA-processing protein EBP2, putative [Entamoeba invadens IP1]